ncbi:hypothetical protein CKO28_03065 [Rhodovibrio sodomensis]|uniref:Uncharacterized protein n=1 Tax=Rhodovibrio sodomensis TaxID=1088 RepID=A0ABS1DAJ5_9PROT|nr:hypothetical protein [Rhodovibrio sodomensis]MBK1667024.1 hypothetical protein [Rhodovibrio sodomensis]
MSQTDLIALMGLNDIPPQRYAEVAYEIEQDNAAFADRETDGDFEGAQIAVDNLISALRETHDGRQVAHALVLAAAGLMAERGTGDDAQLASALLTQFVLAMSEAPAHLRPTLAQELIGYWREVVSSR